MTKGFHLYKPLQNGVLLICGALLIAAFFLPWFDAGAQGPRIPFVQTSQEFHLSLNDLAAQPSVGFLLWVFPLVGLTNFATGIWGLITGRHIILFPRISGLLFLLLVIAFYVLGFYVLQLRVPFVSGILEWIRSVFPDVSTRFTLYDLVQGAIPLVQVSASAGLGMILTAVSGGVLFILSYESSNMTFRQERGFVLNPLVLRLLSLALLMAFIFMPFAASDQSSGLDLLAIDFVGEGFGSPLPWPAIASLFVIGIVGLVSLIAPRSFIAIALDLCGVFAGTILLVIFPPIGVSVGSGLVLAVAFCAFLCVGSVLLLLQKAVKAVAYKKPVFSGRK